MPHIGQITDGLNLATTQKATPPDVLDREDFTRLLVAQLRNQDPLEPMNSQEFIGQLTQFSNLEQLMSSNAKLDGLVELQRNIKETRALSHLGKSVSVEVITTRVANGEVEPLEFVLELPASSVAVSIFDSLGRVVWTKTVGNVPVGTNSIDWDGKDLNGQVVGNGDYGIHVTATDTSGQSVPVSVQMRGTVEAVTHNFLGEPLLMVGNRGVPLEAILQVEDAPTG